MLIIFYYKINTIDDCISLQSDIHNLIKWSKDSQLLFNFNKCEFLQITNRHSPITAAYNMGSKIIKQVLSAKYLGITINENLNYTVHISTISKLKASSALDVLQRNLCCR